MKLIAVLMFSTLIWPSPFLAGRAKKINPVTIEHISAKILHFKHDHHDLLTIKHT
jgi:hypothetical protein